MQTMAVPAASKDQPMTGLQLAQSQLLAREGVIVFAIMIMMDIEGRAFTLVASEMKIRWEREEVEWGVNRH